MPVRAAAYFGPASGGRVVNLVPVPGLAPVPRCRAGWTLALRNGAWVCVPLPPPAPNPCPPGYTWQGGNGCIANAAGICPDGSQADGNGNCIYGSVPTPGSGGAPPPSPATATTNLAATKTPTGWACPRGYALGITPGGAYFCEWVGVPSARSFAGVRRRGVGDSPAIAMPNGQPVPPSAAVKEAQAAAGYYLQASGTPSPVTPAWSQSDVDGVYGTRTQQVLQAIQTAVNGNGNTLDDINTSDGSLTTATANESASPFDTLNWLRSYLQTSVAPTALPYTFWGQSIQVPGTPVLFSGAPVPGAPVPVPGAPGPVTNVTTGMTTGMEIALAAVAVGTLGLIGYAVYANQKVAGAAARGGARARPRARHVARYA